jgi:signal transduction histidine kinase/CHASE1-domain containing sensor protein
MQRPPSSLGALLRRHATPAAVLLTGTLCALAASGYGSRAVEAQQDARFATEVTTTMDAIRDRMEAYTSMLRAARALHEARGEEPDRATFERFVAALEIARHYPGTQGIGWAKLLHPQDLAAHEATVRRTDPGYHVWPAGDRPVYSSIVNLEPLDWRNRRAIGYDMFSDPSRRQAMERARDTGEVAATSRVELVQEAGEDRQAGFLMYLAVYTRPARDVDERQAYLAGWMYAPFRAEDLLNGILSPRDADILRLAIYDGPDESPGALLYRIPGPGPALGTHGTRVERFEVAGRQWTLAFGASEALASRAERALPLAVLVVGLAVTALLFAITRSDARSRQRTERAALRAAFLADASKALSASPDYEWSAAEIAALAARRIVDACVVLLLEPSGPVWIVGHADTARAARAAERLRGTAPTSAVALGITEALARAAPLVGEGPRVVRGPPSAARAALQELEVRAYLTVPLVARGEAIGAIALLIEREPTAFDREDVPLAEDLARLVAAAVDTSRLLRREQEAVTARDEFLSIASHELKTPLTSLILHTDALRAAARRASPGQLSARADLIRRSADRLARLVSSLLDISRIGAGRLDLEREEADLAEVVREVAERFEEEAGKAGCELRVDAAPAPGFWDRLRLDQVVTNLLANALKYGAGAPIDVTVRAQDGRAFLTVRDRGIGISEDDQRRIFQRFERAVSQRNYGGFGLGLWIVRQIVEAQGGTVHVESAPGKGSTFTVELETGLARRAAPDASRPAAPAPDETRA